MQARLALPVLLVTAAVSPPLLMMPPEAEEPKGYAARQRGTPAWQARGSRSGMSCLELYITPQRLKHADCKAMLDTNLWIYIELLLVPDDASYPEVMQCMCRRLKFV